MSRGQLYCIAQSLHQTAFSTIHYLLLLFERNYLLKKSDIQTFFSFMPFLTKERVFSQMQIVNIYN